MAFLEGKRILVTGVATDSSIAYGIARRMRAQGAELVFSYQAEPLRENVVNIAKTLDTEADHCLVLDVSTDENIESFAEDLKKLWPEGFDGFVHSMAFAPKHELMGSICDNTTRKGFRLAHEISCYSLLAMTRILKDQFRPNPAILTLSYLGAVRTVPNYNVMGLAKASLEALVRFLANDLGPQQIRVNGISAGPIKTMAASAFGKSFDSMLDASESRTPLRRNVTIDEVGNLAAFLASELASGITGEISYVDCGYNVVGVESDVAN